MTLCYSKFVTSVQVRSITLSHFIRDISIFFYVDQDVASISDPTQGHLPLPKRSFRLRIN